MKMKNVCRRIAACAVVLSMVLSLAACGGGSKKTEQQGGGSTGQSTGTVPAAVIPEATIKDGVVRSTLVKIADESFSTDGLQILALEDDIFYGFNYSFEDVDTEGYELVSFKSDGSGLKRTPMNLGENSEIVASTFRDGCFYLILATYTNSPALDYELSNGGATDSVIPDDLSEDATSSYQLSCVSTDGKPKWTVDLQGDSDDEYFYVNSVEAAEDGVLVITSQGVDRYNAEDGAFVESVCRVNTDDMMGALYALRDGSVIMMDEGGMGTKLSALQPESGEFKDIMTLPGVLMGALVFPGKTYSYYLAGDDGIFGVSAGSDKLVPVVNFVNSDLDLQGVSKLIETEDGKLAVQAYSNFSTLDTWILEPVAPEDVEEKKEITLGGYYIEYDVRSEVINFNKENNDYRISLIDYSQYDVDTDDEDTSTGLTRMNADIVSGKAPDIMFISEELPAESYVSKGLFEDLTERFENDPDIDRKDFLQNVVDAFRVDGKMYYAVPGFYITGIAGKEKFIGDGRDLTIEKIKKIAAAQGIQNSSIFGVIDRYSLFQSAIQFSGDQFIDRENNTCDFNTPQFRELLEFVKDFPEVISEDMYNDYFTQYLGDRAILGIQYINTVYDYEYMTRQLYGDLNVTITGFPSAQNKGASIASYIKLAINSSSKYPDGCWSFVRRFLVPEYQLRMENCLPISEKGLEAQGQAIIESIREQREAEEAYMREMMGEQGISFDGDAQQTDEETDPAEEGQGEDASAGDTAAESAAEGLSGEQAMDEPEDYTGKPIPREDFNGTDEEYEEYLKEFEEDGGSFGEEEMQIIEGEDLFVDDSVGYGMSSLPDFGQDDVEALKKIVKGLTFAVNGETEVLGIITEEAEAYFAGQKSVEEVSEIIQSRVSVYLKENE
ncbi:MAG: extracellular solute-binding protein [Eubacteriales bacterium]|nr:extracellular solute-binding protein [Eubacteriales bacterium]